MALTNAEKQKRWREERNRLANLISEGSPSGIAEAIFREVGAAKAKEIVRVLDKRLHSLKPDCKACNGTGLIPTEFSTIPCDCGAIAKAILESRF